MPHLLADIGGTKTLLALVDDQMQTIQSGHFKNQEYRSFEALLESFLAPYPTDKNQHAIIAVAGPVQDGARCKMTNLNWSLDSQKLTRQFSFDRALLMNDLQATAWGMTSPNILNDLHIIGDRAIDLTRNVAVISPGTGLGEACIIPGEERFSIIGSEGGHKTIAPFNPTTAAIINQHWQLFNRPLSRENWFSGSGLRRLYSALFPDDDAPSNESITKNANSGSCSKSHQCVELFTQGIYAEAGDIILQYLAWGGVIIAGGIPPHIDSFFKKPENVAYLYQKSEYKDLLRAVPIALCYEQSIPIRGLTEYLRSIS